MVANLSRRTFLSAALGGTALVLTRGVHSAAAQAGGASTFAHGVASGDPTADRVVLWTRVTAGVPSVEVRWEVATDEAFDDVVAAGTTTADAARDHTVHVDPAGLAPARDHWFRFHALDATSPVGRTRTLPAPGTAVDAVRLGMLTCAEYEFGYFGAYRHLAERNDVDVVLHLGDFIYEFGVGYGSSPTVLPTPGPAIGRTHEPATELLSLADYRTRYAQYRSDPDSQALHAAHPIIVMYDDHEVANDSWRSGAQNHQPEEGPFETRARAARQAWREWMPIRVAAPDPEVTHRSFRIGDLAELWMLDERRYRDQQPTNAFFSYGSVDPVIDDPTRTMLGVEQRAWLLDGLGQTAAAWRLLGNSVPFFPLVLAPGLLAALGTALGSDVRAFPPLPPPLTVDDWNGYAAERRTIVGAITEGPFPDVLVLTGDYHETFVSEIPVDIASYAGDGASAAVEFVTPAVTSPGLAETFERGGLPNGDIVDAAFEANLAANNPWVRHHEGRSHGFGVVELTPERAQFDVVYVTDRFDRTSPASVASSWEVRRGTSKVAPAAGPLAERVRSTPADSTAPAAPTPTGSGATLPATGGAPLATAAATAAGALVLEALRRAAGGLTLRRALLAVVLATAVTVPAPAQAEAPGPELVEVCEDSGVGDRTCASALAGSVLLGSLCADSGAPTEACAAATDGEVVDPEVLARYEHGWVHRALRLQSRLDEGEPLLNSLWPHSHNSANSTAYAPSVSSLDPNQRWSVLDQLRMGIRAIELDLHPAPGGGVVLCHGRQVDLGATILHLGCSVDRPLSAGLDELRSFLDLPGNEREVVLVYLENQLESDPALHDVVARELERSLGTLVARPAPGAPCAEMPLDRSRADLLAEGRRVLVVGNCGPGGWGAWVHERGPRWDERSLGDGYAPYPACTQVERVSLAYDASWIRVYEDATWLSAMVDGRFRPQTADDVRAMVRCGVDMVGFDRISPTDPRLSALVWSWAENEPVEDVGMGCVALGTDGRFHAANCDEQRGYACRTSVGAWVVPEVIGMAGGAAGACAVVGAAPATPPTGWENERLKAAVGTRREVWLSIANPLAAGRGAAPSPASPPAATRGAAPSPVALPATGRALPTGAAAAVLALLVAVLGQVRRGARSD